MTERAPNDLLPAARPTRGMSRQQLAEALAAQVYAASGVVVKTNAAYGAAWGSG